MKRQEKDGDRSQPFVVALPRALIVRAFLPTTGFLAIRDRGPHQLPKQPFAAAILDQLGYLTRFRGSKDQRRRQPWRLGMRPCKSGQHL